MMHEFLPRALDDFPCFLFKYFDDGNMSVAAAIHLAGLHHHTHMERTNRDMQKNKVTHKILAKRLTK